MAGGVTLEDKGPFVVMRLDKARGNAIDGPLLESVLTACAEVRRRDDVKGVLLASAHPKLFCPGLDLVTLVELDRKAMEQFMGRFSEALFALYELPRPMVAAINGAAVAGGCILALCADHRILRRGGVPIGLNEVKVGVPLPWSVTALLRASVPPTSVSEVALLGRNFADEEAVRIGLAHALADAEGFEAACMARLEEYADKDAPAVSLTKQYVRRDAAREMRARDEETRAEWLDCWFSDPTRKRIRAIVDSVTKKG